MKHYAITVYLLIFALMLFFAAGTPAKEEPADAIYINGNVWTADSALPRAEAFAIRDDKIVAVGTSEQVARRKGPATTVVDLKGKLVVPGFNDAHIHFLVRDQVEIEESDDLKTIQKRVMEFAKANPEAPWILGRGWGYASFPNNTPHRRYLDELPIDRPIVLSERDGHMAILNGKALEAANITIETADPEHGRIVKDADGRPTGELQESALDLLDPLIPPPTKEELYTTLKRLLDRAASYGLTSVQNASFNPNHLPAFDRVLAENGLKLRFYWALPFKKNATQKDFENYRAYETRYPADFMKFGAAKGMLDGVVDAQTAAMFEPYTTGKNGIAMWEQEELNRVSALYDREGFQIMLHAIGDKAIHMALNAYEYVAKTNGPRERRHRIEHIEVPRLADLPRFKQIGVIASTQALFANPDKTTLENYSPLLGPERASHANAFKLFDDAGAVQAFGSDWPVFSMEVLRGIYCAVTRKTPVGTPPDGYFPQHRIPVEAALRHFTIDAAFASFDEKVKGSLTPGKYADFVVLSENILEPPAEKILKAKVLLTVVGGKTTYSADEPQKRD